MQVTTLQNRGLELTPRDTTVLRELNRWRCMQSEQIMRYFPDLFRSVDAVKKRMGKLEAYRFVAGVNCGGQGNPTIWCVKPRAETVVDLPLPVGTMPGLLSLSHDLGLVDLWIGLREQEGGTWTTERELWRERKPGAKGPMPDGRWTVGNRVVAVELELSRKAPALYDPKMKWARSPYTGALEEGYTEVVYYTDRQPVRTRVQAAIERNRAGQMVRVEPVPPTVSIRRWGVKGLDI